MNPWHQVIRGLLKYFQDCEGTTYLGSANVQIAFVTEYVPEELHNEVLELLVDYHAEQGYTS